MNEKIDKENYEELKRCFQFLCDKLHWSIGFKRTSMDGSQTISPNVRIPKNADENYRDYVELVNGSYFLWSVVIESISSYRTRRTQKQNVFNNYVVARYKSSFDSRGGIKMNELLGNKDSITSKFIDDLYKAPDAIDLLTFSPGLITADEPELAKYKLLYGLTSIMTHPDIIILPGYTINKNRDKLHLKYLSTPIPEFHTLEELRIKMDLYPIETITKEFKVID
jgi:hypothetical protein